MACPALLALAVAAAPSVGGATRPLLSLDPVEVYADGFLDVRGVLLDSEGNLFVSDREAGTVTRISPDRARQVVAGGLERPIGLAFDPAGRLLIAEERGARVVRLQSDGRCTAVVSGIKQPRWLAARPDGTLFIGARRLRRGTDPEPDDESAEPEMVLALRPAGTLDVFADGFKGLQGLAADSSALFAATQGLREDGRVDGVVFRIPIDADGNAGAPAPFGAADRYRKPVGLALDRLGALFLTSKAVDVLDDTSRRAVVKLHPTAAVTPYAENLEAPQGAALDADGNLYVADGKSGRVLRFRAPAAPTLAAPAVTRQSALAVVGTAGPGDRVDLVLNDAATATTALADAAGAYHAAIALAPNAANDVAALATSQGGAGLTSRAVHVAILHDDLAPSLVLQSPPADAQVGGAVDVRALAADGGSGLLTVSLTLDGAALGTAHTPELPAPTATATATWDTTADPDGAHTLAAVAADGAGNATSTARLVVVDNTPPDTEITDGPDGPGPDPTFSLAGADNLTPASGLRFSWRVDGGEWSEPGPEVTVTLADLAAGPHLFEARAADLAGNVDSTPAQRAFVRGGSLGITITAPVDGATVAAGTVVVTGTLTGGDGEVAVLVNSVPALVQGAAFAVPVALDGPTAVVNAVATSPDGRSASHTIVLAVSASAGGGALVAVPASGLAALTARFSLVGAPAGAIEADFDGDGAPDLTGAGLDRVAFVYPQPGLYVPRVTLTDGAGGRRVFSTVVQVLDRAAVDTLLHAKWNAMKSALARGDVEGALAFFADAERGRYRAIFTALDPHLAGIAQDLGDIELIYATEERAKYRLTRAQVWGGQLVTLTYYVYFVRDGGAFWRLGGL
jgi:sugar lactone lactonase YvrE